MHTRVPLPSARTDTLTGWFCDGPVSDTLTVLRYNNRVRPPPPSTSLPLSQPPLVSMQFLAEKPLPCIPPPLPPLEDGNEGQEEKDGKRMCGGHREETWPRSVLGNVKDICCFFLLGFNSSDCIYQLHPFVLCLCFSLSLLQFYFEKVLLSPLYYGQFNMLYFQTSPLNLIISRKLRNSLFVCFLHHSGAQLFPFLYPTSMCWINRARVSVHQ